MSEKNLTHQEQQVLLSIAREAIEIVASGLPLPEIDINNYSENLREIGSAFVTLTDKGRLRGCIGGLEPRQPLILDVQEHAAAAAVEDYRFQPVRSAEVSRLKIEISRLTPAVPLTYSASPELLTLLRPGIDGVIISDGKRRATFLPQVWEKIPDCEDFLTQLCQKMGASGNLWKVRNLAVWTYQVEAFEEE
jgi:uncharacterized protein